MSIPAKIGVSVDVPFPSLVQGGNGIAVTKSNGIWTIAADTAVSTVGLLPLAGTVGRRRFVTDASAATFNSIVAAGGANKVPVFDDGTNWRIG